MQSSLEKRVQRMEKISMRMGKLHKRIKRVENTEFIDLENLRKRMERMKKHARLFADERAKMELRAIWAREREARLARGGVASPVHGQAAAEAARSEETGKPFLAEPEATGSEEGKPVPVAEAEPRRSDPNPTRAKEPRGRGC